MFELKILVGFLVGTLIGMTGLGGGVLLLPILIYGLHVPAMLAVGSDALFNFITKIGTSWVHLSKGTVRRKVVIALACGSIPGSYGGVAVLSTFAFFTAMASIVLSRTPSASYSFAFPCCCYCRAGLKGSLWSASPRRNRFLE